MTSKNKIFGLSFFLLSIISFAKPNTQNTSFLSASELLMMYDATLSYINNMSVSYLYERDDTTSKITTNIGGDLVSFSESDAIKFQYVKRIEEGDRFLIDYSIDETGFEKKNSIMKHAFDGKISMAYYPSTQEGYVFLGKENRDVETKNALKLFLLNNTVTLKSPESQDKYPGGINYFKTVVSEDGIVRQNLETVSNQLCHVIDSYTKGGILLSSIWMSADLGGMPIKFIKYSIDGKIKHSMQIEEIGVYDVKGMHFAYPKKASRSIFIRERKIKYNFECFDFEPNIETNQDTFKVSFPKGAKVYDKIIDIVYLVGDDTYTQPALNNMSDYKSESVTSDSLVDSKSIQLVANESSDHNNTDTQAKDSDISKGKKEYINILSNVNLGLIAAILLATIFVIFIVANLKKNKRG